MLNALRSAGEAGMTLDEVRIVLFGNDGKSNSLTKKLLERMKAKGYIRVKIGRTGPHYEIIPGR